MRTKSMVLVVFVGLTTSLLSTTVTAAPAGAATHALVQGSGSTWAANLVNQWIADVNPDGLQVVYTPNGSTQGRKDYAQRSVDFAVTDQPYAGTDELGQPDSSGGRELAYVPLTAGATAFAYRLEVDGRSVRNLRLSSGTLAGIFTGAITGWDDPAVTADNNGRELPAIPVTPVVRSEAAGTTVRLTAWLDTTQPDVWRPFLGRAGSTSYFPAAEGMLARGGADGVMNQVKNGANGSIAYVESSYPHWGDLPAAKVRNAAGYFVAPTGLNTAIALSAATVDDQGVPVLDAVQSNPDPRAYPVPSYSLLILPTGASDPRMSTAKRQTLAEFTHHALCPGQTVAAPYGYAPLPRSLVEPGLAQLARLKQADPAVDLTGLDLASCANPTFDPADPTHDVLDTTTPPPEACDRPFSGPCGTVPDADAWPTIVGAVRVGETVRARPGTWSGPGPFAYQWLADGAPITGATAPTYAVPVTALGRELSVRVTSQGVAPVPEDTTGPLTVAPGRLELTRPRIVGRPIVGRRLTVVALGTAGARARIAWYADGQRVRGANGPVLRLRTALRGKRVSVLVTLSRPGYAPITQGSRATRPVARRHGRAG